MAMEWATTEDVEVAFEKDPGELEDANGTQNDQPVLVISHGEDGIAIEGTEDELEDLLWRIFEAIRPERAKKIDAVVERMFPDSQTIIDGLTR